MYGLNHPKALPTLTEWTTGKSNMTIMGNYYSSQNFLTLSKFDKHLCLGVTKWRFTLQLHESFSKQYKWSIFKDTEVFWFSKGVRNLSTLKNPPRILAHYHVWLHSFIHLKCVHSPHFYQGRIWDWLQQKIHVWMFWKWHPSLHVVSFAEIIVPLYFLKCNNTTIGHSYHLLCPLLALFPRVYIFN